MADTKARFSELSQLPYIDQAKWFLNGFWNEAESEAENIWKYTHKFIELDDKRKKEGNELDEFQAHKFLESLGETLTVIALREKLRQIDLNGNGKMALMEYLCFKYRKNIQQIVDAPQGGNEDKIKEAQAKLEAVQRALDEVQQQLEQQRRQEEVVKNAEAELRTAIEDLARQEESYRTLISTLEAKSKDTSGSIVARNKAANELAQVKSEDPLPLRKAKITQEAALRRVEKERKAAEERTAAVEKAYQETEARFVEAQEYLQEVKKKGGVAFGAIWWMERELTEAKKYLPKRKQ